MLEQHVVLVSSSTNAPEHVASHEVVDVRTEPVDDLCSQISSFPSRAQFTGVLFQHTSWSSHMLSWGIWALAVAKGSVEYLLPVSDPMALYPGTLWHSTYQRM